MGPAQASRSTAGNRIALLLIILLASAAAIPKAQAAGLESMTSFHIPPSDLPTALVLFSRQADLQVVSAADQVSQWRTQGVNGRYTPAQALAMLLTSTGLEYRITATGVVTIGHFSPAISAANSGDVASRLTSSTGAGALQAPAADTAVPDPAAADPPAPGSAAADAAPADATPAAQVGAAADTLQEVVVTAERRATNQQTTPVSMTAISGVQLETTQVTNIVNLNQVSPNLLVYNAGKESTADIRGIGNSNQGGIEEPGVLIVRDGLPNTTEGFGADMPFYDIADVEVLRGPQGTFAGDNSTGGAIYITSQNPNFTGIDGYIESEAATYSDIKFDGAVNLPVSDTLALRIAFNEETRGSFFHDENTEIDGPDKAGPYINDLLGKDGIVGGVSDRPSSDPGHVDNRDGRLGLLWKPTENLQSLTKLEFDTSETGGVPTQPNTNSFLPLAPGLPCPTGEGTAPNCHNIYYSGYSGSPYLRNDWASQLTLYNDSVDAFSQQLQYTLSGGTALRLVAGDQEVRVDQTNSVSNDTLNVGSVNTELSPAHIYTGEFDALSPTTGPLSWIAGASYNYVGFQQSTYNVNTNTPYSPAAPAISFFVNGNYIWQKSEGVFAQVSWQFTHTLQLVVGARQGWDRESVEGATATYRPNLPPIVNAASLPPVDRVPTGKVDVNWTPLPGQFFYAFAARGYKPGEVNLGTAGPAHYEDVNDYELGWKGRLASGHVLTQVGGYYMQYFNMIWGIFNPAAASATADTNIGYSNLKGIEASLQSSVEHVTLNISAALNKSVLGPLADAAKYKFPAGVGITNQCAPGQTPNANNTNCTNYAPYELTLGGESLPYSPDFTANGTLQYSIPVGGMALVPSVTYSYTSSSYADLFQSDNYFLMPSHSLWGANLAWIDGPWTVSVYGTNLTNKLYVESISGSGELYGNPRQIGLQVNRTF